MPTYLKTCHAAPEAAPASRYQIPSPPLHQVKWVSGSQTGGAIHIHIYIPPARHHPDSVWYYYGTARHDTV